MVFLIPAVATVARVAWMATRFGVKAVAKNPVKTGLIGAGVVYQDEISNTVAEVSDKSTYIKYAMTAGVVYLIYRGFKWYQVYQV